MSVVGDAAPKSSLLVARPDLGTLEVTGPERLSWLQGVLTCEMLEATPGAGRWALALTKQGKILADVLVVSATDAVHLGVVKEALPRLLDWLAGFLVMEDADVVDSSVAHAWFTLHGPRAAETSRELAVALHGVAAPVDMTGLGDAALVVPRDAESAVRGAARDANVPMASASDWLALRIERLVPLYGVDMNEQRSPHDVSLERRCISWSKGCYLGQEVVCMQDMRGKVKRRLAALRIESDAIPALGTPVIDERGATVGETKSAGMSTVLGGVSALAALAASSAEASARLTVGGAAARVVVV